MTVERWAEIEGLFQEALSLTAQERESLLLRRCEGDPDLRREVESLLANDAPTDAFLTGMISGPPEDDALLKPGAIVGEYKLDRLLGQGGMGAVYLARRVDGEFDQRVAIKFSSFPTGSGWTAERFRAERQILARLEHPNIARLLDGGTVSSGAPYLVMEYVDGLPLIDWCKRREASVASRLRLFLSVCDAVAYVHRNLIVHRDIKPGNILVTAEGVPKLLDFGISKAFDSAQPGADDPPATVRLMTLGYASPEQVQGLHVTTAADVYALGAVLYELLSGSPRFDMRRFTPLTLQRAICETDPVAPSAVHDSRSPRGDLDSIVAMAMQRAVAQRYSSVEQLAADIRAFLESRPVKARAATPWYRGARFLGRHRAATAIALVITLATAAVAVKWIKDARRMVEFYREIRNVSRFYLAEAPERLASKPASGVRSELGRMFDERMQALLSRYSSDPPSVREIALGYEAVGKQFGLNHNRAAGMSGEAQFYYGRAIAAMQPLYDAGRADQHGSVILGRSSCGLARLRERESDPASKERARLDFERCLAILRGALGSNPSPGDPFVYEFVMAHFWAGDHELAAGRPTEARLLVEDGLRIARRQTSSDKRAPVWESAALLCLARIDRPRASELVRQARDRLAQAETDPPAAIDFGMRLHEVELALARVRVGDAAPEAAEKALAALHRDFPSHPLALEISREWNSPARSK